MTGHRYLVFIWDTDYPEGGMKDIHSLCPTLESGKKVIRDYYSEMGVSWNSNFQIYDIETHTVVCEYVYPLYGPTSIIGEDILKDYR